MRRLSLIAALGVLLAWLVGPFSTGAAERDELLEVERAAAANPDDPDLAWLEIRALLRAGERERAVRALVRFIERWDEHPARAWLTLGRTLHELGRHSEAIEALGRAAHLEPLDGSSHFYRGLALRALGRHAEARQAFLVSSRLEGELAAEALMLAGLSDLQLGHEERGRALLERVVELKPSSESAQQAQLLLGGATISPLPQRKLGLFAEMGFESDSNVTLEGDLAPASSDESDVRMLWGAGVSYRLLTTERASATIGYRYAESAHEEHKSYDLRSHTFFASGQLSPLARATLRLDAFATDAHLDDDRYLRSWVARPSLIYDFGGRRGASRLYTQIERASYHDPPLLSSLDRDGTTYALGLEHYWPLPLTPGAWTALGIEASRTNTEAHDDIAGFDGAFDDRRLGGSARLGFALPWRLQSELSLGYEYARYTENNVIGFLFEFDPDPRRDRIWSAGISLVRPLTRRTELELRYTGTLQDSNLDIYSYDRHIVGLHFRVRSF